MSGSALVLALLAVVFAVPSGAVASEPPLRQEDVAAIAADLEVYVPVRMRRLRVPGVSVALIRDGRIVWTKGFGVTQSVAGGLVTPETVFSVASNGKVIFAYTALRLAALGRIEADAPLRRYLESPWLPRSEQHDSISLYHVLTHTSGLSNFLRDRAKRLEFAPGTRFSYSGVGFMYAQRALEERTGESLDELAWRHVFEPLEMTSSYFGVPRGTAVSVARGHVRLWRALALSAIAVVPAVLVAAIVATFARRWIVGRWGLGVARWSWLVAAAASLVFLASRLGGVLAAYVLLCLAAFSAACGTLAWVGTRLAGRLAGREGAWQRWLGVALWVASAATLLMVTARLSVPLPDWFPVEGNAASSLRSTAPDLARFLIELAEGRRLDPSVVAEMRIPIVEIDDRVSWGLGVGIQRSRQGDSLWHWGNNLGSNSLMVVYPDRRVGVVVLTNSDTGSVLTYDVAGRALGGEAFWRIR